MEKLNFKRNIEDFYILEIDDKGNTIEFDMTDMALIERIMNASDNVCKIGEKYKKIDTEIAEKYKDDEMALLREYLKSNKEHDLEMRTLFDSFLGEGSCQKIFGNSRVPTQYLALLDALEPHFQKMKFASEKARKRLVEKYQNKQKDVL